jgi:hypothetical protein
VKTSWEKRNGSRVDYIQVLKDGVCVGRRYGSGASDNAGIASFSEFLDGKYQDIVIAEHGPDVLQEVIAAVRRSTSWDVFISYVYAERAEWEPVIEALRREGISVFQDYRALRHSTRLPNA